MKKQFLIIFSLLVLSIPSVLDLFIPGPFTSHDLQHHIIRQFSMDKLLSEGSFPPRWSGELNHEYGYPVFLFNYPFPPILGEVFHKLGLGFIDSTKAVLILSLLVSPLGMYLFLRSLLKHEMGAFLGAIFYLYAPVRFLNVYVAAALGNSLALGIVPFLFWGVTELIKTHKIKWVLVSGFCLSLLILTHNVSTVIFLPVLTLYVGVLAQLNKRSWIVYILALLLGFGLSTWFWLPSIVEKQYIRYDQFMAGFYQSRFVPLERIWYSTWGYGSDFTNQVGLIHWGAIFLLILGMIRFKRTINLLLCFYLLFIFGGGVFMMTEYSQWIWDKLQFIQYIQFPARFLVLPVFASSIIAGILLTQVPARYKKLILALLVALVLFENRNHWHINQSVDHNDLYYQTLKTTSAAYDEHLPWWGKPMTEDALTKWEIKNQSSKIKIISDKSETQVIEIDGEGGEVRLNQYFFPGWKIFIDGREVSFDYLKKGEDYGLPVFKVPSGKHLIEAKFTETPIRFWSDLISLGSWMILLVVAVASVVKVRLNKISV